MEESLEDLNPNQLVTTWEAARLLGVSPQFLEGNGRTKGPVHIRLSPGCVRYRLSDIREWIESRVYRSTVEAVRDGHTLQGPGPGRRRGGRRKKAVQPEDVK